MRRITTFGAIIAIILVANVIVAADINEVKKNAAEKVHDGMNAVKRLVNDTLIDLPFKEDNLKTISKHVQETGSGLLESTNFNIHKTAVTGLMAASFMEDQAFISSCVKQLEKKAYDESKRYFLDKFTSPRKDLQKQAEDMQNQEIRKWTEEYNDAVVKFTEIYSAALRDIDSSFDERNIERIVYDFERSCTQMMDLVTRVLRYLDKLQLRYLQILDSYVVTIRAAFRLRVDHTYQGVKECLPNAPLITNQTRLGDFLNEQ